VHPALITLVVVLLATAGFLFQSVRQRRKALARLRREWGMIQPINRRGAGSAAEAWQELDAATDANRGLDERTWLDLELDDVVATLDRTRTGLGHQALYRRLRNGSAWNDTPLLEQLAVRFGEDPALREAVGIRLHAAGRSLGQGLWIITRPGLIRVRWWYWSFPVLALAMLTSIVLMPFEPRALAAILLLVVLNLVARTATAWQVPGLLAPMRQMAALIRTAEQLSGIVPMDPPAERQIADDVRRLRPLRRVARWVSRDPRVSGDLLASIWEYLNLLFIFDANALVLSARRLRELAPVVARVGLWVGDVDLALAVASLRAEPRAWSLPIVGPGHGAQVTGMWHPMVESPVPNDAALEPGRGIVITGANMSGKSTYLRTMGLAAVLARGLNTCPATAWRGQLFEVRSLIGRADDLATGRSYYQVEAEGVVALLERARDPAPALFLLDELLRGTNTIERLAAGEAVLRALIAPQGIAAPHVAMVATHDGELVAMLADRYDPWHFRETLTEEGLLFEYRRHEGAASTRTAIALLEAAGAPPAVVEAARDRAQRLDEAAAGRTPPDRGSNHGR